ncbi:hypothetical protein A2U01_0116385, partial [Trifolium medium]|nr:hypothetical protein [Trifolium medium]
MHASMLYFSDSWIARVWYASAMKWCFGYLSSRVSRK